MKIVYDIDRLQIISKVSVKFYLLSVNIDRLSMLISDPAWRVYTTIGNDSMNFFTADNIN